MRKIIVPAACTRAARERQTGDRGAAAIQYGLIVALVAAIIAAVVTTLGGSVL